MNFLEAAYGSGQSHLKEAIKMQLKDKLDGLQFPANPTPAQIVSIGSAQSW
jgi:hypothetical protein